MRERKEVVECMIKTKLGLEHIPFRLFIALVMKCKFDEVHEFYQVINLCESLPSELNQRKPHFGRLVESTCLKRGTSLEIKL